MRLERQDAAPSFKYASRSHGRRILTALEPADRSSADRADVFRTALVTGQGVGPRPRRSGTGGAAEAGTFRRAARSPARPTARRGDLAAAAQRRRTPRSVTIASIGMSKDCGWIVAIRCGSDPTPIANGCGARDANVRSK